MHPIKRLLALSLALVAASLSARVSCSLNIPAPSGATGYGAAVALPGDLNADGRADFVVGAARTDALGNTDPGRAYVYFGGTPRDGIADRVLTGAAAGDR